MLSENLAQFLLAESRGEFACEFAVRRASGKDHRESFVHITVANGDVLEIAFKLKVHDVVQNNLGAKPFGFGLILNMRGPGRRPETRENSRPQSS